jgi:hypothetical protein
MEGPEFKLSFTKNEKKKKKKKKKPGAGGSHL